ncbi:NitT/TauT family transport system substrate-binding protein [Bradyrhizobium sp. AZCC 1719]|uniref:ABC transporter substrate-binding protein n=1 Tax=Bradyrhizobium sp. AZCC 1719 TaxID=3117028 RepID=UPI002FEFB1B5
MLNRRTFIAGLPLAALAAPSIARAAEPVIFWGPPATPSVILAQAIDSGLLKPIVPEATFKVWKTPDEMRAGISSGSMAATVVPTYVAANLHNRGIGLRLVNVLTDGLLFVVAPAGTVNGIAGLKGKRIAVPFRNDMPDYIFRRLLAAADMKASDLTIEYSGTPLEAVQMLMMGRVDAALLSEPASSAVIAKASTFWKNLERAVDCQKAWPSVAGTTTIAQAGLAITDRFAAEIGASGVTALHAALEQALQAVIKNPAAAASASAAALDLPAAMVEKSIPFSRLVVRTASAARADLTSLFDLLAKDDPRIIGGKQPDDRFYAL